MKTVEKTIRRVIIELTSEEISKMGFEHLWDDIRNIYPAKSYELHSVREIIRGMVVEVELRPIIRKAYSASTYNM
jgi:hypothetical protein